MQRVPMSTSDRTIVIVAPPPSSLRADDHTREHALIQILHARTNPLHDQLDETFAVAWHGNPCRGMWHLPPGGLLLLEVGVGFHQTGQHFSGRLE